MLSLGGRVDQPQTVSFWSRDFKDSLSVYLTEG
jgi:hypothetical protein